MLSLPLQWLLRGGVALCFIAGGGALGALPQPVASAATDPSVLGSTILVPTPGDHNASDPLATLNGVSCTSADNCVGVGSYVDTSGHHQAMAAAQTGGLWGQATEVAPPSTPPPDTDPMTTLNGVSCTSAGDCVAVGSYMDDAGDTRAFYATETAGTWGGATALSLPASAAVNPDAVLNGVSCSSAGNCSAVGTFVTVASGQLMLAATETSGTWTSTFVVAPAGANTTNPMGVLNGVSCTSAGNCVAVGRYESTVPTGQQAVAATQTAGVWSRVRVATPATPPANTTNPAASLNGVSCLATDCVAVGTYDTAADGHQAWAATTADSGATWTTEEEVATPTTPGPATDPAASLNGVSCESATDCVAVGTYTTAADGQQAMEAILSGTTWTATQVAAPSQAMTSPAAVFNGVSCAPAATDCSAVGKFEANSGAPGDPQEAMATTTITHTLTVTKAGTGTGTVTSVPAGINCGSTCDASFPAGQIVTLTATAGTGSTFEGWSGDGCTGTAPCEVTMSQAEDVTATFNTTPTPPPGTAGYWTVASDGGIFTFGHAQFFGSMGGTKLNAPVVGMAPTPDHLGYWEVASDGGVFTFGDAKFFGSTGGIALAAPVVGMAATPDGGGYWLVAADGGIFTFGDAKFFGSMGGTRLAAPVVGMSAVSDGQGYWEAAADGGIFTFGDARFFGSMGGTKLNQPMVGMAATIGGGGYWTVASDGGIFTFGDAKFWGSMGGTVLNKPMVGMAATPDGAGYWTVASDGGIFSFNAPFEGSMGGIPLNQPMVGMAAS